MTRAIEHGDYTPGLAYFTCDGCTDVITVAAKPVCGRFDRALKTNDAGQKIRCAECLVSAHGDLND